MPKPLNDTLHRLADVLTRENVALRAMDLPGAVALLPEKTAAIGDLVVSGATVTGEPAPPLIALTRQLDGLAQENRRLLERAIAAQQRVIGIVVRALISVRSEPSYGAKGWHGPRSRPMALSTRA
jgi:hypothetical protein